MVRLCGGEETSKIKSFDDGHSLSLSLVLSLPTLLIFVLLSDGWYTAEQNVRNVGEGCAEKERGSE
jgi:hypothetical protein